MIPYKTYFIRNIHNDFNGNRFDTSNIEYIIFKIQNCWLKEVDLFLGNIIPQGLQNITMGHNK